jgi:hypothetical protein
MEEEFQKLKQWDKTMDEYAASFLRMSRFAPSMVAKESDKANRFQQGLQWEIQKQLASHQLDTYQQVLTAARRVELVTIRENMSKQQRTAMRPIKQVTQGPPNKAIGAPPVKHPAQQGQQQLVCGFCKKLGHTR